jgi:hypothetical protein
MIPKEVEVIGAVDLVLLDTDWFINHIEDGLR